MGLVPQGAQRLHVGGSRLRGCSSSAVHLPGGDTSGAHHCSPALHATRGWACTGARGGRAGPCGRGRLRRTCCCCCCCHWRQWLTGRLLLALHVVGMRRRPATAATAAGLLERAAARAAVLIQQPPTCAARPLHQHPSRGTLRGPIPRGASGHMVLVLAPPFSPCDRFHPWPPSPLDLRNACPNPAPSSRCPTHRSHAGLGTHLGATKQQVQLVQSRSGGFELPQQECRAQGQTTGPRLEPVRPRLWSTVVTV